MGKESAPQKLLVVDDDAFSRDLLHSVLSQKQFDVRCVESVAEAEKAIRMQMPDAVLLDVMMPDIDGLTYLRRLRSSPRTKNLPVILVSALDDTDHVAMGLELGANDYVVKPISPRLLIARIRVQLEQNASLKKTKQHAKMLQQLASQDDLTGVLNRRSFMQVLDLEVSRSRRYGHGCSLLMIDADDFKRINDAAGHEAGDEVLKQLVERIKQSLREADRIGRYGGDEFCVVLPETDQIEAGQVAERLREAVESSSFNHAKHVYRTTVSVGLATLSLRMDKETSHLLAEADSALYQAKREGRNRVCSYNRDCIDIPETPPIM